jgi:hypothetical protein
MGEVQRRGGSIFEVLFKVGRVRARHEIVEEGGFPWLQMADVGVEGRLQGISTIKVLVTPETNGSDDTDVIVSDGSGIGRDGAVELVGGEIAANRCAVEDTSRVAASGSYVVAEIAPWGLDEQVDVRLVRWPSTMLGLEGRPAA